VAAELDDAGLERHARARRRLLEDQRDVRPSSAREARGAPSARRAVEQREQLVAVSSRR
jgi:hypothetical protein